LGLFAIAALRFGEGQLPSTPDPRQARESRRDLSRQYWPLGYRGNPSAKSSDAENIWDQAN